MARTFMASVFSWMFLALTITGIVAYVFGSSKELMSFMYTEETGIKPMGYVIALAPVGLTLLMGFTFHRLPWIGMLIVFIVFALLMGLSLSFIFLKYTDSSIYLTFGICAGMYGLMALLGYTTNTDLSKFGPILMMGAMGIVIASVVNMFIGGETMSYILGFAGVVVFTGLTAYEVQQLKRIGSGIEYSGAEANKLSLIGAFTLYITFINLFISLLRLFGERK